MRNHGSAVAQFPPVAASIAASPVASPPLVLSPSASDVQHRWWARPAAVLLDVALLLGLGVAFPLVILLVGAPFALVLRAVIELTR